MFILQLPAFERPPSVTRSLSGDSTATGSQVAPSPRGSDRSEAKSNASHRSATPTNKKKGSSRHDLEEGTGSQNTEHTPRWVAIVYIDIVLSDIFVFLYDKSNIKSIPALSNHFLLARIPLVPRRPVSPDQNIAAKAKPDKTKKQTKPGS